MREPDADTLMFFDGRHAALPLFESFESRLLDEYPKAGKRVQKTQITYFHRHVFACVSFARVRRKAEMPDPYIVVTLGLPRPLESSRAAVQSEPYPGRWTVHIVIGSERELDEELFSWLREAYDFSERK